MAHLPHKMPAGCFWLPTAATRARRRHASRKRSRAPVADCTRPPDWAAGPGRPQRRAQSILISAGQRPPVPRQAPDTWRGPPLQALSESHKSSILKDRPRACTVKQHQWTYAAGRACAAAVPSHAINALHHSAASRDAPCITVASKFGGYKHLKMPGVSSTGEQRQGACHSAG